MRNDRWHVLYTHSFVAPPFETLPGKGKSEKDSGKDKDAGKGKAAGKDEEQDSGADNEAGKNQKKKKKKSSLHKAREFRTSLLKDVTIELCKSYISELRAFLRQERLQLTGLTWFRSCQSYVAYGLQ